MLGGYENDGSRVCLSVELVDDREELQRLRTRADDDEDILFHGGTFSVDLASLRQPAFRKT